MNCFMVDFLSLNSKGMFSRLGQHKLLLLLHVAYTLIYCSLQDRLDAIMSLMFSLSPF